MKKFIILFALFAGVHAWAQKPSIEEIRIGFAETMASFTEGLAPHYSKGLSYERFEASLLSNAKPTAAGRVLLKKAYGYLSAGTPKDRIVKMDSGLEMAKAAVSLGKISESALFGLQDQASHKITPIKCKWYQLRCYYKGISNLVMEMVEAGIEYVFNQDLLDRE